MAEMKAHSRSAECRLGDNDQVSVRLAMSEDGRPSRHALNATEPLEKDPAVDGHLCRRFDACLDQAAVKLIIAPIYSARGPNRPAPPLPGSETFRRQAFHFRDERLKAGACILSLTALAQNLD